jgi:hypothetical protein
MLIGFINIDWLDAEEVPNKPIDFANVFEEYRGYIELQLAKDTADGH